MFIIWHYIDQSITRENIVALLTRFLHFFPAANVSRASYLTKIVKQNSYRHIVFWWKNAFEIGSIESKDTMG